MASDTINSNSRTALYWNGDPSSNAITETSNTVVTNSAGKTVYWWTRASQPTGGGTQLGDGNNHTFPQQTATITYNFGDSTTSGTLITLTVTGGGGDDKLPT